MSNKDTQFRKIIKRCGLSQKGVAALLDVRYDTVRNWCTGRTLVPNGIMDKMDEIEQAIFDALD